MRMAFWEQLLLGLMAVVVLVVFWPAARAALERSRQVENPDWKSALIPVALVVLFVILLIAISRH